MGQKTAHCALALEALLCAFFALGSGLTADVAGALCFPWQPIGAMLRRLSLSGQPGNALAWAIFAALGSGPLICWGVRAFRGRACRADALLALVSAALFGGMYAIVNPGLWALPMGLDEFTAPALCVTIDSTLLAYALLRLRRALAGADEAGLVRCLSAMLFALCAAFVFEIFGAELSALASALRAIASGGDGLPDVPTGVALPRVDRPLEAAYALLRFAASALSPAMGLWVARRAAKLLEELRKDRYSDAAIACADRLAGLSGRALTACALAGAGINLLQSALLPRLTTVRISMDLPLVELGFLAAALLFAQLIRSGRRLKDDNELFI